MNTILIKEKHPLSIHVIWMFILITILGISRFLPLNRCLFHDITGYPCLSCGISRAANALFEGNIFGMISYNPLIVLFCVGLFFFSLFKFAEFIFRFRIDLRFSSKYLIAIRILTVIVVIANWTYLIVMER